jgi:hypothetical protein
MVSGRKAPEYISSTVSFCCATAEKQTNRNRTMESFDFIAKFNFKNFQF